MTVFRGCEAGVAADMAGDSSTTTAAANNARRRWARNDSVDMRTVFNRAGHISQAGSGASGSTARLARSFLLLLHLLFQAIDPTIQLVDPLPVLLRLARRGLRLGERLTRNAFHGAKPSVDAIDACVNGTDLALHITLCGASAETDRTD
uniref:hypothetical protein n=1 Tax=uncultured Sphingomonas sp. TaxID=158754 RepID=UPI0035CBFFB0